MTLPGCLASVAAAIQSSAGAALFFGLPGDLFLGAMALVVIASVISGLVLYPPFVRRFGFATVRTDKSRRVLWLDLHNLTGIIALAWLLIVAVSGAVNTLHAPVSTSVQETIAKTIRKYVAMARSQPASASSQPRSIDAAIAAARDALPETRVMAVFFPGAEISPDQHYVVLAKGTRTMTPELFYAALIDARTGTVADVFETDGIAKAMLLTEPPHFPTSFGGLPIKIAWAFFDLITIVVLCTGLYLWVGKRRY